MDPKPYLDAIRLLIPDSASPSFHLEYSLSADGEVSVTYKAFVFTGNPLFGFGACHIGTGSTPSEAILALTANTKKDIEKAAAEEAEKPILRAVES
jgi:hypothetical protein